MVESIRAFLSQDLKTVASAYEDFTEHKQSELRNAMKTCS